jgi:hypothetical protein
MKLPIVLCGSLLSLSCGSTYVESYLAADLSRQPPARIAVIPLTSESPHLVGIQSPHPPAEAGPIVTRLLHSSLSSLGGLTIIPPEEVDRALTENRLDGSTPDRAMTVGRRLNADAVLIGTVRVFRERQGTAMGIREPASVGFDIQLLRVPDRVVLWIGRYYETQKSLTEDITGLGRFMRRKGRWLSAEELAADGMAEVLKTSPWSR